MWVAQHEPWCKDQTRYEVLRERGVIEDTDGNTLDADPSNGEVSTAECAECGAKAEWQTETP